MYEVLFHEISLFGWHKKMNYTLPCTMIKRSSKTSALMYCLILLKNTIFFSAMK
jgi:hypothetical protein